MKIMDVLAFWNKFMNYIHTYEKNIIVQYAFIILTMKAQNMKIQLIKANIQIGA